MPYVTSIERNAEARGLEEGREEGRSQGRVMLLLRQLTRTCGELPDSERSQVQRLSLEQCESLGDALFDFESLDDLQDWLRLSFGTGLQ